MPSLFWNKMACLIREVSLYLSISFIHCNIINNGVTTNFSTCTCFKLPRTLHSSSVSQLKFNEWMFLNWPLDCTVFDGFQTSMSVSCTAPVRTGPPVTTASDPTPVVVLLAGPARTATQVRHSLHLYLQDKGNEWENFSLLCGLPTRKDKSCLQLHGAIFKYPFPTY